MKTCVETITPERAAAIMETMNTRNRPLSDKHARNLAKEMTLGRWKLNGDAIRFNGNVLIDGQHRLQACIYAGVPFESLVIYDLDGDIFDTIDAGKRRGPGDILAIKGEINTRSLAAALVVVDKYLTGRVGKTVHYANVEIEALLQKHPEVRLAVNAAGKIRKKLPLSPSILAGYYYLFRKIDADLCELFFDQLMRGSGLEEDQAVYLLRERILSDQISKAKLSPYTWEALLIKAWNFTRAGAKVRVLKLAENEQFPVIR